MSSYRDREAYASLLLDDDDLCDDYSEDEEEHDSVESSIERFLRRYHSDQSWVDQLAQNPGLVFSTYPGLGSQSQYNGKTALHLIIDSLRGDYRKTTKTVEALKAITRANPDLLRLADQDGSTALYHALLHDVCHRSGAPVLFCSLMWQVTKQHSSGSVTKPNQGGEVTEQKHPLTEALAVQSGRDRSENLLHLAFRNHGKFSKSDRVLRWLRKLAKYADTHSVVSLDGWGRTPLHYAVDYAWGSLDQYEIVQLLINTGDTEDLIKQSRAVLDLCSNDGSSVYQHHLLTREEFQRESIRQPAKRKEQQLSIDPKSKERPRGRELLQDQSKLSVVAFSEPRLDIPRASGQVQPDPKADAETIDDIEVEKSKQKVLDDWSEKVQMLLKKRVFQTRSHEAYLKFSYGQNPSGTSNCSTALM